MIQNINIHKLNDDTNIKSLLPLTSISIYDIKLVLWVEIDANICDMIYESNYKRVSK